MQDSNFQIIEISSIIVNEFLQIGRRLELLSIHRPKGNRFIQKHKDKMQALTSLSNSLYTMGFNAYATGNTFRPQSFHLFKSMKISDLLLLVPIK